MDANNDDIMEAKVSYGRALFQANFQLYKAICKKVIINRVCYASIATGIDFIILNLCRTFAVQKFL